MTLRLTLEKACDPVTSIGTSDRWPHDAIVTDRPAAATIANKGELFIDIPCRSDRRDPSAPPRRPPPAPPLRRLRPLSRTTSEYRTDARRPGRPRAGFARLP